MDHPRPCGCKGCRTCLVCEQTYQIEKENLFDKFSVSLMRIIANYYGHIIYFCHQFIPEMSNSRLLSQV